jgi:uncharacterized delta-60 repeat protein
LAEPSESTTSESAGHALWGYYLVRIDEKDYSAEIIPIRATASHWNVLQFLEQGPCTDCFKLAGVSPNPDGTLNVNVSIKHPFTNLNVTGFDVRGIAMFSGSHVFPESGLIMSDRTLGEGEVVNANGYTTLYNPTTSGHALEGYTKGKLATDTFPTSTLNGYKRFISDDPSNTRNAFYVGEEIIATYKVDMPNAPNPWVFGYAVDACWAPPINKPVVDPMTDFGPEANCPEAWKIEVSDMPIGVGLTDCGGQAELTIIVYDWQGKDDANPVVVECPELFDGEVTATWKADGAGFTTYEAVVENVKNAPSGTYMCLVSKEALENDPGTKPWLDISAYQLHGLDVIAETKEAPTAAAEASQLIAFVDDPISFDASDSHDNDCGGQSIVTYEWDWDNDGTYDEEGVTADHSWPGEGTYHVQLKVTDNESQIDTLDEPLEVVISPGSGYLNWARRAGGTDKDHGNAVTALSDNSTVVTGFFNATATFGPGEPNETVLVSSNYEIFIARYNADGSLAWAKQAGGPSSDIGNAVTALSDNSIVSCGSFMGTAVFGEGEPNQTELTSSGLEDVFVARYNPDGALAWAKRAGGNQTWANAVSALSDDSVAVTGSFMESATFGPGEPNETVLEAASYSDVDIFVARYNSNGTLAWAKRAGGIDDESGAAIAALSDNSMVVTGGFMGTAVFGKGEPNNTYLSSAGYYDIFIAQYNPDGTLVWAKRAGGSSHDDGGFAVTSLSDDSCAISGYFNNKATFGEGEPNETELLGYASSDDIFVARYNNDGTLAWATLAGYVNDDYGYGITTLSDDSIVLTGCFYGSADFGIGGPNQTALYSAGQNDVFVARYSPDGSFTWAKSAGGPDSDVGLAVCALSNYRVVVTGYFQGSATFGQGEPNETVLVSAGDDDIFVARYYE